MNSNTSNTARRWRLGAIGATAAATHVLAGCTPADTPAQPAGEISEGGTLSVGISGEPGLLDPTMSNTLTSSGIFAAFGE